MAESDFRFLIFDFRLRLFVCFVLSCFSTVHADDGLQLKPVERWSNVFAESETRWTYRVSAEQAFRERAAWRLTIGQRTAASGEFEVRGDADKPADGTIALRWPQVKDGSVLTAQLTVSVGEVRHERVVLIFPRDAFADRREWLKALKLTVFDPPGKTVEVFEDNDIPHERFRSREALDDVTDGIVVVGEGVSLKKHEGLMDDLRNLATRGVPVLCLASDDGELAFPGDKPQASAIQLRRADVIRELDKRLDAEWWPKGRSQLRGLQLQANSDEVVARVNDDANSWPWCEWQFVTDSDKPSRLIWCGFGIIRSWNDGPTPRYLFDKILERIAPPDFAPPQR